MEATRAIGTEYRQGSIPMAREKHDNGISTNIQHLTVLFKNLIFLNLMTLLPHTSARDVMQIIFSVSKYAGKSVAAWTGRRN